MVDPFLYAADCAKPKSQEWRKGPKVTINDMKNGTGFVEKITKEKMLKGSKSRQAPADKDVMGFGKYRELTLTEVKKKDSRYFDWCLENVKGFEDRAEKLGLLDDRWGDPDDKDQNSPDDPFENGSWIK